MTGYYVFKSYKCSKKSKQNHKSALSCSKHYTVCRPIENISLSNNCDGRADNIIPQ